MGFADDLFEDKDYYRAITEYKRFIYLFPESPLKLNAEYKIGLSYFKGERYEDAAEIFHGLYTLGEKGGIAKKSLFKLGEVYFEDGRFEKSSNTYERFLKEYPDVQEADNARFKLGFSYMFANEYDLAGDSFQAITSDSPFYSMSSGASGDMAELIAFEEKSPYVAGGLAAVLPGAGHVYCGRYQDGATAFLLTGLFVWGTVEMFEDDHYAAGGVLGFFSLMWYSGNIYSAVNSAHKYNRDGRSDILNKINSKYNISYGYGPETKANYLVLNMRF
jgi:TolA-binding protein